MLDPPELPSQLEAFLSTRWERPAKVTDFVQITGGYSRYMARFVAEDGEQAHRFILRADPPPGQSIIETDRTTEWQVLNAVAAEGGIALPRTCWFDEAGEELGSPAIILELIDGETLLSHLQVGEVADHRGFTSRLADMAAGLHSFDADTLPAVIARPKSWDAYIDGCVAEWREAEAEHVESDPFMRLVAAWLDANRPPETSLTMVHGDFQPPNIIVAAEGGELHMIDWELTRIGDPREDLGWWALCSAAQPPDLIEADSEAFYARYRECTGLSARVVNPATVAYFTVLSSASVFINVIKQTASMSREETGAISVAYMTNAIAFMHGVWIDAMRRAGAWEGTAQ